MAGREKYYAFAGALIDRGLVDAKTLLERAEDLPVIGAVKRRVKTYIQRRLEDT